MQKHIEILTRILKNIDSSRLFQSVVIAVIVISALVIGAKTHNLSGNFLSALAIMDVVITVFFAIEIIIRYLASENTRVFYPGDGIFSTRYRRNWQKYGVY